MAKKKSTNTSANAAELNQQSIDYLGVSKQPFANEILSEESFFKHQALDKISDSLVHQVQFSELLLLIEGIHGAGKTAFFRQFIQLDIANTKTLAIHAEATDTLVQIQQKTSLHLQDLGDANHLDDNLKSLKMFDQTPLMVINNSHVLSDTTLQELLRYQQQLKQEHDVSLKILLFANTGMGDTLQKISDIQSDQMYTQVLPSFSPKQASAFINHRLRCAGYFGETLLNDAAITQIAKQANGSPLDIMIQAVPFIDKSIAKILKPSSSIGKKIFITIMVLCVLIGAGYAAFIYFNNTPNNANLTTDSAPLETDLKINEAISQPNDTDVIDILENDEVITAEPSLNTQQNAEPFETQQADNIETTDVAIAPIVESIIESIPEAQIKPKISPSVEPEIIIEEAIIEKNPATEIKPLNPALLELKNMGIQNAAWLLQQSPQNWTLQLLGARDPQTLLKFAQTNHLSNNTAWYKTWLSAKPYYVMVHGNYASRDAARNAIENLPQNLRSLKPWVKSIKSAQQAIK